MIKKWKKIRVDTFTLLTEITYYIKLHRQKRSISYFIRFKLNPNFSGSGFFVLFVRLFRHLVTVCRVSR